MTAGRDADHYSRPRADAYAAHHRKNLRTRVTTWREQRVLERALERAGHPATALDIPCGTGRFWPAFARAGVERLTAADNSEGMLDVARANALGPRMPEQILSTSVFAIGLPDGAVELVASLRFFHHLAGAEDRRRALAELSRVSARYVALSLWVDGNLGAWRRARKPQKRESKPGYSVRVCISRADIAADFEAAGLTEVAHFDVWPRLAMWRLYLLRK